MLRAKNTVSQEEVKLSVRHPIKVQRLAGIANSVQPHDHEFYEVVYVHAGEALHITDAGIRRLSAGDFLVLAPGQVHAIESPQQLTVYNTYYLSEWLLQDLRLSDDEAHALGLIFLGHNLFPDRAAPNPIHVKVDADAAALVAHELAFLDRATQATEPNGVLLRASLLKTFAILADAMIGQLTLDRAFLEHPLVRRSWERMEQALANGEPCNIADWAASMNYSADAFSRKYRELTGENPSVYFLRRRLQRGAHGLIHGSAAISDIAHQLGFTDQAHFARSFRQHYGMSPMAYRRRFQPGG